MTIPTSDLTLGDLPPPDASTSDLVRFAGTLNGYKGTSQTEIHALAGRWDRDGGAAMSLHDLRRVLFLKFRADYHGGGYPDDHPLFDQMRRLVVEIAARLAAPALEVWRGDITALEVDAVVNAANERMLGGSGVDGAIHAAAGPELLAACRAVPEVRPGVRCPTGAARVTPGFRLPARFVIHTVGPVWKGGGAGEVEALASAYRSSLEVASGLGLESVAFPALSTGVYGFPAERAARVAVGAVRSWRPGGRRPLRVVLVAFDADAEAALRAALPR